MRFAVLRAAWLLIRTACDAVTVLGIAGLGTLVALDELPALLTAIVRQMAPELHPEIPEARLDGLGRLELRGFRLRAGDDREPLLTTERAIVSFSIWGLRDGHVDDV